VKHIVKKFLLHNFLLLVCNISSIDIPQCEMIRFITLLRCDYLFCYFIKCCKV